MRRAAAQYKKKAQVLLREARATVDIKADEQGAESELKDTEVIVGKAYRYAAEARCLYDVLTGRIEPWKEIIKGSGDRERHYSASMFDDKNSNSIVTHHTTFSQRIQLKSTLER